VSESDRRVQANIPSATGIARTIAAFTIAATDARFCVAADGRLRQSG